MDRFLEYYERELANMRRQSREFSQRYPKLAGNLLISAEASADPHVEHLIQSVAFLNARIAKRLDDDYPDLTHALLSMTYGHYTRTIPSYSIAQIDYRNASATAIAAVSTVPRGTEMKTVDTSTPTCRFRTAYDVVIAPVRIAMVKFQTVLPVPAPDLKPQDGSSSIQLRIEGLGTSTDLMRLGLPALRLFIDGEPSLKAALRDTLFTRAVTGHVQADEDGHWIRLPGVPIDEVGFADGDAMIPFKESEHPAYRLLTEYFAYPEKFDFFDIDLAMIAKAVGRPCRSITVHISLSGPRADSSVAQHLKALSVDHLLLGCTPVINLFKQAATPIRLTHQKSEYPLLPDAKPTAAFEVHSVDSVKLLRKAATGGAVTEFMPYYSHRHNDAAGAPKQFWLLRRNDELASTAPGNEYAITLVDRNFAPSGVESGTVGIELTCSNRNLPAKLQYGRQGGDLAVTTFGNGFPVRLLRKPSNSHRFTGDKGSHWGLIAHLSLNHRSLTSNGLAGFIAMLRLYAIPDTAIADHQIEGIIDLTHLNTSAWVGSGLHKAYVNGVEIRLTVNEEAFVGTGLHAFIRVLDHFFGLHVHLNSFTQLTIISKASGKELLRCPPRNGALTLV